MLIAERDNSRLFSGVSRASNDDASPSTVADAVGGMKSEIGVITGIRKMIVQVNGKVGENRTDAGSNSTFDEDSDQAGLWIEITPTNRAIAVILRTNRAHEAGMEDDGHGPGHDPDCTILLKCEDVHRTHRTLVERGIRFSAPPAKMPFGWLSMFDDDEGRRYLIGQW